MVYEKSLKKVGFINVIIALVLISLIFIANQYLENKPDITGVASFFFSFAKFILVVLSIIFLLRGIGLFIVGGKWHIEITDNYISWQVPKRSNYFFFKSDDSFYLNLSEVKEIIFDCGLSKGADDIYSTKCIFVDKNGKKYEVTRESGVSLEHLIVELEGFGLKIQKI